jgi:hypothetical protein
MQYLRKALITTALVGLTLGTVRIVNATPFDSDTIADSSLAQATMNPTPDDPRYDFTCCNNAPFKVNDLEVLYAANVMPFGAVTPDGCVASTFANTTIVITCPAINVGDTITETTPAGATFVSGCWTTGQVCVATAGPVPEPATINLLLLGLLAFLGYGLAGGPGLTHNKFGCPISRF